MTIYWLIFLIVWGCAGLSLSLGMIKAKILYRVQSFVLIAFASLKFETGYDWPVYKQHYEGNNSLPYEPGYEALVSVFNYIGLEFKYYWGFIGAGIALGFLHLVKLYCNRHRVIVIAALFSFPDFFIIPSFSIVRQAISIIFFLYFLYFFPKNKLIAIILAAIAAVFHVGIVFIFILAFAFNFLLNGNPIRIWFCFVFGGILYLFPLGISDIFVKYLIVQTMSGFSIYFERDTFAASFVYRVAYLLSSFFIIYLMLAARQGFPRDKFSLLKFNIGISGLLIPIWISDFPTFSTRYFGMTGIFICSHAYMGILYKFRTKIGFFYLLSVLISSMVFYRFFSNPFSIPFVPYQDLLFYDENNSTGIERTEELINILHSLW